MRALVVGAVAALLCAGLSTPAAAATTDPARVLVVGDSITQGLAGDVTWRYHLAHHFAATVDMVGPKRGQAEPGGANLEVVDQYPHAFDYDHAARWGMCMSAMDWTIGHLVETYDPDVVVEQLGANDLFYCGQTPETLAALVTQFVADARAAKPDVDVVLGQVTWNWDTTVQEYNALLLDVAATLDTPAARVLVAVMPPTTYADTYDGSHPNAQGEVKIAAAHVVALEALGVGAAPAPVEPPPVSPPVLRAPAAPDDVDADRRGKRVKVTWTKVTTAESYQVRCGKARAATERLRAKVRSTKPGTCRVRAVNAAGVSPWTRS